VAARVPDIRFHDLRHTHASLLIAAGVHPKAIQARLGHTSITTTLNRYGHLMPNAFSGVGERLDALLSGGRTRDEDGPIPASVHVPVKARGRHETREPKSAIVATLDKYGRGGRT